MVSPRSGPMENSIYARASRLMRWLEQCAEWCCGGWKTGAPRFSRLANEGRRLFAETLLTDDEFLAFQRQLLLALWERRDAAIPVHQWLDDLREAFIDNFVAGCRTLQDEAGMLEAFIERTAAGGDCADLVLGVFAGQVEGKKSINLSTLHSSKGREFSVVIMFGIDDGRIPRAKSTPQELVEARRLFYVGFTRAETELHIMFSTHRVSPFVTEVQERLDANE